MKRHILTGLLLCLYLFTFAQVDRSKAPTPDAPQMLETGLLIPFVLPNGLRVYLAPIEGYPKFTMSVNIDLPGYKEEPRLAEKEVLSLAYQKKLSSAYPEGQVDSIAKHLGALLAVNQFGGTIKGMKRDADALLGMYADVMLKPIIKQEYIDQKAELYQKKLARRKKRGTTYKPAFSSESKIDSLLFGVQEAQMEMKKAYEPQYNNLDDAAVRSYLQDKIVANNALIVMVGDFSKKECQQLIARHFGEWQRGKDFRHDDYVPKSRKEIIQQRHIIVKDNPNAVQSRIGFNWYLNDAFTHFEGEIPLEVLSSIFGARLFNNLREEKALCYNIQASLSCTLEGGRGAVNTSVRNNQTALAIENILFEMMNIRNKQVSEQDLSFAKNRLIGNHTRSLSGVSTIPYISFAMQKSGYNLPDDYLQTKAQKYYAVSRDKMQQMAHDYIKPFKCVITVSGKLADLKGQLEQFGQVSYFDKDGKPVSFDQ